MRNIGGNYEKVEGFLGGNYEKVGGNGCMCNL